MVKHPSRVFLAIITCGLSSTCTTAFVNLPRFHLNQHATFLQPRPGRISTSSIPLQANNKREPRRRSYHNGGERTNSVSKKRNPEIRFFDKITKDPVTKIRSEMEAKRLLKAALIFEQVEGPGALLYRLADQEGIGGIRKCLEYMTEEDVFGEGFLPLLEFLGREDLNKPVYSIPLTDVLIKLYKMPFLVPCISDHIKEGHVTTSGQRSALIWYLTAICLKMDQARSDDLIRSIAESLERYGGTESLQTILDGHSMDFSGSRSPSLSDIRLSQLEVPGGRHDNDKQDFRSISIVPTLDEFLCDADPFLPKIPPESIPKSTQAQILDRHFRLLREDVIGPFKEQQDDPRRKHLNNIVYEAKVDSVETGAPKYEYQDDEKKLIIGRTDPCISFKFMFPHWIHHKMKQMSKREKEQFWQRNHRFFPRKAMVCLQRQNGEGEWVPIRFATITRREAKELSSDPPVIGLSFMTEDDTLETLKELSGRSSCSSRLMEISRELFAYDPILRGLQMMPSIPFSDELIMGSQKAASEEVGIDTSQITSPEIQERLKKLDPSQHAALQNALKNRVALIQGPPGTGKTFVGGLLAQILLASTQETILVVTYTNHALDDFLEGFLDVGITDIVRLGGRSRSDRLTEYNLREKMYSQQQPFSSEQTRRYAKLKGTIEGAENDIDRLQRDLKKDIGDKKWGIVSEFLEQSHPEQWRQLHLTTEESRTHSISDDYLWKQWMRGNQPRQSLGSKFDGELWSLDKNERREQKLQWQHEMYEPERAELATSLTMMGTAIQELRQLKAAIGSSILSKARIIGCTTTKAAMDKGLLDGLSPGIVLVEEAAEIMEAHVLTSLSAGTKRLIMIGDHKQLRPKCQHYPLTVEAGRGFDLNRSLFERLASSLSISTLDVQHRMHPQISAIPKLVTYPNLKDAPSVSKHPLPAGLANRIVFINHDMEEDHGSESLEVLDTVSRTNMHEVTMVVKTVRYLLQQLYKPSDLVVLTPYLGQMLQIHKALSKEYGVFVDGRDVAEAREHLGSVETLSENKGHLGQGKSLVRVATIDNYQGEEARIVLVSLVRSNSRGDIGFLKEAERVNVMLSRARECEIIIGSKSTFEKARGSSEPLRGGPLWKKIFKYLEDSGFVYQGLPVTCQNHNFTSLVRTGADFEELCPDGGCNRICNKVLDCGHLCKKRCHVGPCMQCEVLVHDRCPRGHPLIRKCSQDLPDCKHSITWRCPLGHRVSGPCYFGKYSRECKLCLELSRESTKESKMRKKREKLLLSKYEELDRLNIQMEEARQAKQEREELIRIENELAIIRKDLAYALETEQMDTGHDSRLPTPGKQTPSLARNSDAFQNLSWNVKQLLESSHPDPLEASVLLRRYKQEYDSDLRFDAKKMNKSRSKPKLKDILADLPCCEILMEPGRMSVRLRRDEMAECWTQESSGENVVYGADQDMEPEGSLMETNDSYEIPIIVKNPQDDKGRFVSSRQITPTSQILEESPTLLSKAVDSDDDIGIILRCYQSHGALAAHDLLDQKFPADGTKCDAACALRSILHHELDPNGLVDASRVKEKNPTKLSRILRAITNAFQCENEYPLQARDYAQVVLKCLNSPKENMEIPSTWISRMEELSSQPVTGNSSTRLTPSSTSPDDEWDDVLSKDRGAPAVMSDSVLPMIGLDSVKRKFIDMYHRLTVAKEQNECGASSYNVRFEGNPGTGKTTVARHYGSFLKQLGVLCEQSLFKEVSGAKLIHEGIKGLEGILEEIKTAGGGVIFVDEAYQLASDREGRKVLDFVLPLAESLSTEYGDLVWVFAGYRNPMEKLFELNEGLPSRFPIRFIFDDYNDDELQQIFEDLMLYRKLSSDKKQNGQQQSNKKQVPTASRRYNSYNEPGLTMTGRHGGEWTYGSKGWTDQFENMSVDPAQVGFRNAELVTPEGDYWTENNGFWTNQKGLSQSNYPGSPPPAQSSKREKRPNPFQCENEKHLRIAIRRLGRQRGNRGFGNAREVSRLFDRVRERQAHRISEERKQEGNPHLFTLEQTDLLGPKVTEKTLKNSPAWKQLEAMEGLLDVKESVEHIFKTALKNIQREKREEKLYEISLNRLFLGNPGTGKTTVAKLYGEILVDLGLLSKGEVMMKVASDFLGGALGQSEKQTQNILQAAEGNVLVIDEAYSLYSGGSTGTGSNDPYKTAVIDTIVEKVQSKPGADIAVILLGYTEEMKEMMRNVNPGLSRRFQIEDAFMFPDFNDESLCRIMMESARKREVTLDIDVAKRAVRMLAKARAKPNFGNAGSVDNLLSKAITRMQSRDAAVKLIPADFGCVGDGPDSDVLDSLFDDLIGCDSVKDVMEDLRAAVEFSRTQGMPGNSGVSFNYLFLGSPGTGKTTVAKRMGKMFHALGLLPSDELKEAKASDLVTGYTGQAGKKTRELLKQCRGGVLFIDEAYQLNPSRGGQYMSEAVDELVGALTEEEYKDKLLVILAGYDKDMDEMLDTNPGLHSRFSERVHFRDFDVNATIELLELELQKRNIPLDADMDRNKLEELAKRLVDSNDFGNGRDVVTWADRTYKVVAKNHSKAAGQRGSSIGFTSCFDAVEASLLNMLESREVRLGGPNCAAADRFGKEAVQGQDQKKAPPPIPVTEIAIENEEIRQEFMKEPYDEETLIEELEVPDNLFEGINASVLNKLQDFVDEQGLGSEEGARRLASLNPNSQEFGIFVAKLEQELELSHADATAQLLEWQSCHKDLEDMLQEQLQKTKMLGVRPIWRCAVCGRADKPWIACHVAPFIVRYEKVNL